ncbi:MAG: thioredoxin family protein [Peptococcaceae bacterium]|nr:thioredoxin family protein [Peptococcaceae bacterium]MBQ7026143.1 thioredoxin family protein [Peptococcaceae bacterium]
MKELNGATFEEIIYDEGQPCLVIFSRKSCHVCQEVHPIIDEIEKQYEGKDFGFYHVDVEDEKDLFNRFSLKGVPQVLFFNDGEFLGKFAGKKEEEEYIAKIEEIIG